VRRRTELLGLLGPALASSFPNRLRGIPTVSVCRTLSHPAHPLVRLDPPTEFLVPLPARLSCPDTFPGLPSLIAASVYGVHTRGRPRPTLFRPRRFSRPRRFTPPQTFAGFFRPAATSRVRSSGVSPGEKPHGLVARRCPLVVCAVSLPLVSQRRQHLAPAFRALLRSPVRRSTQRFRQRPARSPLELSPPSGSPSHTVRATFIAPPTTAFHGPRRVASARPDLLLRACLPRPRFPACNSAAACAVPKQLDSLRVYHRASVVRGIYGILTLYDAPFQGTCTRSDTENTSLDYNSGVKDTRFKI